MLELPHGYQGYTLSAPNLPSRRAVLDCLFTLQAADENEHSCKVRGHRLVLGDLVCKLPRCLTGSISSSRLHQLTAAFLQGFRIATHKVYAPGLKWVEIPQSFTYQPNHLRLKGHSPKISLVDCNITPEEQLNAYRVYTQLSWVRLRSSFTPNNIRNLFAC